MSKGGKKYRKIQGELDSLDFVVCIRRNVEYKKITFEFIVNSEIKKVYKKRDSCNRQLVKLYNQNK